MKYKKEKKNLVEPKKITDYILLKDMEEIQSQLMNLRQNADRTIKLINWYCK